MSSSEIVGFEVVPYTTEELFLVTGYHCNVVTSYSTTSGVVVKFNTTFLGPRGPLRTPLVSVPSRRLQQKFTQPLIILFQTLS